MTAHLRRPARRRAPGQRGEYRLARAVARRADGFAGPVAETTLAYGSGTSEGPWMLDGAALESIALALLAVLGELALRRGLRMIPGPGGSAPAPVVCATPRELARAVCGADDGRAYRRLHVAMDALLRAVIQAESTWIEPDGTRAVVVDGCHFMDWRRRIAVSRPDGRRAQMWAVALSAPVLGQLDARAWAQLPKAVVRALGGQHPAAGRLAAHVLSHRCLPGTGRREIGDRALVPVVRPASWRDPGRGTAPGREWRRHMREIADWLTDRDPAPAWRYAVGPRGGKIVCEDRNPAPDNA